MGLVHCRYVYPEGHDAAGEKCGEVQGSWVHKSLADIEAGIEAGFTGWRHTSDPFSCRHHNYVPWEYVPGTKDGDW